VKVILGYFVVGISFALGLAGCGGGGGSDFPAAPVTASSSGTSPGTTPGSATGSTSGSTPGSTSASGSPGTSADTLANTIPVLVKSSPRANDYNRPFVSVTICVPGTTMCQLVDNVIVDTGSMGFRVMGNVLNPALKLPQVSGDTGKQVGECALFGSSTVSGKAQQATWGSVRRADLKIAGMVAQALSIEVINDPAFPAVPGGCRDAADKVTTDFGFNGILGVRGLDADCGAACAIGIPSIPRYYGCDSIACSAVILPIEMQVRNPVVLFGPGYDNGVVITLPPVTSISNTPMQGTLTFGIGTQANNQLGNAKVFKTDGSGYILSTYGGTQVRALLDTGTEDIMFHDPDIQRCTAPIPTFLYCPASAQQLTVINQSADGTRDTVSLTIVRPPVEGPPQVGSFGRYVDEGSRLIWGLPFYFGRTVFTAVAGKNTPAGPGPYIAY
jgi:Protein of unknown function (DUF3443)